MQIWLVLSLVLSTSREGGKANLDEILENRQIVLSLLLVSVKRVKIYQIKPTSRVTGGTVCCAVVQLAAGPDTGGKIKIRI